MSSTQPEILSTFLGVRARLAAIIYAKVRCRTTTADLVQDTFLRIWERRFLLSGVADIGGYLVRTGRNLAIDHRRRCLVAPFVDGIEGLEFIADPQPSAEAVVVAKHELMRIQEIIASMPPRAREVFMLARFEGLSYVEIGQRLNISPKTVFSHMVSALERLKSQRDGD